jgi:hypothetical protein
LSCYMVSLRVATERADLAGVEHRIVDAKREIRSLQTELGTRGRLNQLEDWNSNVLALSAPSSAQFVKDAYALAQLQTRQPNVGEQGGNVRMAAAETSPQAPGASADSAPAAKPAPRPRVVDAIAPAPRHDDSAAPVRRASFEQDGSADRIGAGDSAEVKRPQKVHRASFGKDGSADRSGPTLAAQSVKRPRKAGHSASLASAVRAALAPAMGVPASGQSRNGGGGAR